MLSAFTGYTVFDNWLWIADFAQVQPIWSIGMWTCRRNRLQRWEQMSASSRENDSRNEVKLSEISEQAEIANCMASKENQCYLGSADK
jgi:hypothetical protein